MLFKFFEAVISEMGLKSHDCHPRLERDFEYRGLGLGGGAVSVEEATLLLGIIWTVKPDVVIELGTSNGASTLAIAAALKDCNTGVVYSVDKQATAPKKAREIAEKYGLNQKINWVVNADSLDFLEKISPNPKVKYLVFSDTEIKIRPNEVKKVIEKFPEGTVIAVHDTSDKHPFGPMKLPEKIDRAVVELPTPRGISLVVV